MRPRAVIAAACAAIAVASLGLASCDTAYSSNAGAKDEAGAPCNIGSVGCACTTGGGCNPGLSCVASLCASGASDGGADARALDASSPTLDGGDAAVLPSACNVTLVPNQKNAAGLAIDGAHLYWTSADTTGGGIVRRANLDGTNVISLGTTSGAGAITVDTTFAYWSDPGGASAQILYAPVSGAGLPSTLASGQNPILEIASNGTTVAWTTTKGVLTCSAPGGPCNPVVVTGSTNIPTQGLLLTDTILYWGMSLNPNGEIHACPLGGCGTDKVLVMSVQFPNSLALTPDNKLYFTQGALTNNSSVAVYDGTPSVTTKLFSGFGGDYQSLVVDGAHVYWMAIDNAVDSTEGVYSVQLDGGAPTVLATSQKSGHAQALVQDANAIYWLDGHANGAVMRRAKTCHD